MADGNFAYAHLQEYVAAAAGRGLADERVSISRIVHEGFGIQSVAGKAAN